MTSRPLSSRLSPLSPLPLSAVAPRPSATLHVSRVPRHDRPRRPAVSGSPRRDSAFAQRSRTFSDDDRRRDEVRKTGRFVSIARRPPTRGGIGVPLLSPWRASPLRGRRGGFDALAPVPPTPRPGAEVRCFVFVREGRTRGGDDAWEGRAARRRSDALLPSSLPVFDI